MAKIFEDGPYCTFTSKFKLSIKNNTFKNITKKFILYWQVSDQYSCLVWSTTHEDAKKLLQLDQDTFVDAVNNAFVSAQVTQHTKYKLHITFFMQFLVVI